MLLQAIGSMLPAALAVALSPFPVIGIVLILAGTRGRRNGPLFALGWMAGLAIVSVVVTVVFGGADDPDSTSAAVADWLRVLAGAALVILGVRKWMARPRSGEVEAAPRWMSSLDEISAIRALMFGLVLSGANPKNFVLTASASAAMVETGVHGPDLVIATVAFVLVGSCTVIGAVMVKLFGGEWGVGLLDGVRGFMVAHSTAITVTVMLVLGASVLGDGLAAIGS